MSRLSSALFLLIPVALFAQGREQTFYLQDGSQVTGRLVGVAGNQITIRDRNDTMLRYNFDQLSNITFNAGGYQAPMPPPPPPPRQEGFREQSAYPDRDRDRPDNRSGYLVIPAGSEVAVRTNERIDSGEGYRDRSYSAQVDRDIMDGSGNVIIPRGSAAQLVVRDMGNNAIALDLSTISVNGQMYYVNAEDITKAGRQGLGENKRTGEYVGGGAVLGTLLGAIAGGGKGAAIGALAGGAAGAGAEVMTHGDRVRVPSETVLNFRLDQAVNLNNQRPY